MRAFLSNLLSLMAGNIYSLVIGFVFSLVLVQKLTDAEYGLQSAIIAYTTIVMSLAYMGLFNVSSRELTGRSAEEQHEIYNSIFSLEIVLSTVVCSLAALIAWLMNSFPGPQFIIFLLALFTLVLSYAPIAPTEALLIVRGQMWRMAILQSTYATWTCLAGVLILVLGGGVSAIYIAFSIISVVTILQYMRDAWRLVPGGPRFVIRPRQWLYYLRQGIPGGFGSFFFMATRLVGTYLVYTFVSNEHAGYLGISYLLVQATMLIVWVPYAVSILPVMTRLYGESRDQFAWLASRSLIWLLAATLPVAIGGTLLAVDILRIMGESKLAAAPTLRIFIWMIPLNVLAEFFYRMLLVSSRQRLYLFATALGAALTIICCFTLIPSYGVEAAALASILGTILIVIACGWSLRQWLSARPADLLRLSLAVAGMIFAVQLSVPLSVYIRIGIGALAYCVIAVLVGLFSVGDWQTARKLLAVAQHEPS